MIRELNEEITEKMVKEMLEYVEHNHIVMKNKLDRIVNEHKFYLDMELSRLKHLFIVADEVEDEE